MNFALTLAAVTSGALLLFLLGPVFDVYLDRVVRVPATVRPFVGPALLVGFAVPALQALQSWYRGVLMTARRTGVIYAGMLIALLVTAGGVIGAVAASWPGTLSCVVAITAGTLAETVFLGCWARGVDVSGA